MKKNNERGVNLVMKRKLLVLLMAILVVMAMMPTAAFAANGGIIGALAAIKPLVLPGVGKKTLVYVIKTSVL